MEAVLFVVLFVLIYVAILKRPFKIHEGTIAFVGAILVLLFGFVSPEGAVRAIVGGQSHPWQIIVFFITFAIISTTLEDLGFFKWCAIHTTNYAKHNGLKLFNYLFVMFSVITFLTANDIVILTLTPFVLHLGLHHNKHPKAYLFMLFFVANTGSVGHLLGNLTNIIVAQSFGISFLEFFKYMFIPMIVALVVEYIILRIYFRKELNQTFVVDSSIKPHHAIENKGKLYLVLGILGLIILLALLEPVIGIPLWQLTTVGAILTVLLGRFNLFHRIIRVPWQVILFVTSLFVIIAGFDKTGISAHLVDYISSLAQKPLFFVTFFCSFVASVVAAILNNIPGTILMSNLLSSSSFVGLSQKSAIYSVIIGSNLGANFTIIGALAGLMWIHLIREKNYHITALEFSKVGLIVMIPTVFFVAVALFIELRLF
jgi:arsenical pump membrane protein